jgi:Uma2 family endonuclease
VPYLLSEGQRTFQSEPFPWLGASFGYNKAHKERKMNATLTLPAPVAAPVSANGGLPVVIPPTGYVSVAEYLAMERDSLTKHEYFNGEVFDMAGVKPNHNRAVVALTVLFANAFADTEYEVLNRDQRVRVDAGGPFFHPDVVVAAPNPRFDEDDCLRNPYLVVETLSPSSASYDRGRKFEAYRRISSLVHFVLAEQDAVGVTHWAKRADGTWQLMGHYTDRADTLTLSDVNVAVSVGDIYRRVTFAEPVAPAEATTGEAV